MTENRKAFQHLPAKENPHFLEDGKRIYREMRKKYPKDTDEDMDNILNGICAALICHIYQNVAPENHKYLLQIAWKILNENTHQD